VERGLERVERRCDDALRFSWWADLIARRRDQACP
jgi:hypothetical protein